MEEWSGHNTFAYSLNFDELLQQSHFSSLLWIKIFHFVQRWENVKAITLYQNLNFVKKVDTSLFCHLSSWSCFFPVVVLGRGRGASAPSLFVQPPPPVFLPTTYYCPPPLGGQGPAPQSVLARTATVSFTSSCASYLHILPAMMMLWSRGQ